MEDRETARMRKYGESKTTRIMMATVPHVISGLGLRKFQADGFLLTRVYIVTGLSELAKYFNSYHNTYISLKLIFDSFNNVNYLYHPDVVNPQLSYKHRTHKNKSTGEKHVTTPNTTE